MTTPPSPAILPPFPPPPGGLVIFSPGSWRWIVQVLEILYLADQAQLAVIGPIIQSQEDIMASLADLNAKLDSIQESETANAASLASLGTALGTIIADLHNLPPVGVLTQADLDAAVQKATDIATSAATNAATSATESTQASDAVTPPAQPAA